MKLNQLCRSWTKSLRHGAALKTPENSRLRCILILALLAYGMLSFADYGRAAVIVLPLADAATAVDDGPQDGVFDAFSPLNFGSVNNNGWTSFRTALEYDLGALPAGATINSASLDALLYPSDSTRQLALNGYAGDGTVDLGDFAFNGFLGARTVGPTPTALNFEVTIFLSQLYSSGSAFAGFNFREDPANQFNFLVMWFSMNGDNAPALSVDYTVVPEPAGLPLFGLGMALLVLTRRRHRAVGPGSRAVLPWQSGLGTPNARRRLERAMGRVPGLLFVTMLAGLLAGCTTTAPPPADPHLLDFLQDGQPTKQTVVLKLGQPSSVLESGHIMTYRVGQETDRGYFIREAVGTNWFAVKFSLVLVFDPAEVLERHSLVEVR